jgi:hypothetical protein
MGVFLFKTGAQTWLEMSKSTKKSIKSRKPEKNNRKNRTVKKTD